MELARLREELQKLRISFARLEEQVSALCHNFERHELRHETTNRQVPGTIISIIAVMVSILSVAFMWITR